MTDNKHTYDYTCGYSDVFMPRNYDYDDIADPLLAGTPDIDCWDQLNYQRRHPLEQRILATIHRAVAKARSDDAMYAALNKLQWEVIMVFGDHMEYLKDKAEGGRWHDCCTGEIGACPHILDYDDQMAWIEDHVDDCPFA